MTWLCFLTGRIAIQMRSPGTGLGILTVGRLELGLEEVSGPWEGDSACDAVALSLAVCLDAIRGGREEVNDRVKALVGG